MDTPQFVRMDFRGIENGQVIASENPKVLKPIFTFGEPNETIGRNRNFQGKDIESNS